MAQALALARKAGEAGEVPVGALLVRDGEVLARGWNRPIGSVDPTAHAEIVALRAAAEAQGNYRLPGSTLYVTLEPCLMCCGAMLHARVARLVYAAREPRTGAVRSVARVFDELSANHRLHHSGGLLAEQSTQLLQAFFRARR